jgi:hypothetical protein
MKHETCSLPFYEIALPHSFQTQFNKLLIPYPLPLMQVWDIPPSPLVSVATAQATFFQIKCDCGINKLCNILKIFEDLAKSQGLFRQYKQYLDQKVGSYEFELSHPIFCSHPLSDQNTAYIA